jgi:hypothetical protein
MASRSREDGDSKDGDSKDGDVNLARGQYFFPTCLVGGGTRN